MASTHRQDSGWQMMKASVIRNVHCLWVVCRGMTRLPRVHSQSSGLPSWLFRPQSIAAILLRWPSTGYAIRVIVVFRKKTWSGCSFDVYLRQNSSNGVGISTGRGLWSGGAVWVHGDYYMVSMTAVVGCMLVVNRPGLRSLLNLARRQAEKSASRAGTGSWSRASGSCDCRRPRVSRPLAWRPGIA